MSPRYSEVFAPKAEFQRAVNLSLDLGNLDFVERYIPTVASTAVLKRYLRCIVQPNADRASILIGPYGKGKSHALFLALSIVSEESPEAESAFLHLADQMDSIDPEAAALIRQIRNEKIRLLPIIINDRYLDIRQAFLASLKTALSSTEMVDLMPDNYFLRCLEKIDTWRKQFPNTYAEYVAYIGKQGYALQDYESQLKQYNLNALNLFRECHRSILSGAEFDPLLESDVPTLYQNVAMAISSNDKYSGLFIVFDEFGKYLEASVTSYESPAFKVLQDLAEICCRSKTPRMVMTCVSHKAISEYAARMNPSQQSSFRTVEGRFAPIYFTTTFEGSFSLINGALGRKKKEYKLIQEANEKAIKATVDECISLSCFSGYQSSVEQIVDMCFPMHPLTALALMKLSEKAAQNERTLFTFIADPSAPLAAFIQGNEGRYELATVDIVYDYFHQSIRENSHDPELRELVVYADSLLSVLKEDAAKLIKTIVLFSMVVDNCLLAKAEVICAALQWTKARLQGAVENLESDHIIYTRRSDGVLCLMRSATESVRLDIEHEVAARHNRIDIADQLSEIRDPGYTIPRRYNDQYEIVRYFLNVFVSAEQFMKQNSTSFLTERGFADGYVVYLIGNLPADSVQEKLQKLRADHVLVLLPTTPFAGREAIEECAAIRKLLEKATDEVEAEELSYYFDDMLQLVNKHFADLFDNGAMCVTVDNIKPCKAVGTEVSHICGEKLYPDTPRINHEMINRSTITGIMKQVRSKVIDAIFNSTDILGVFGDKTAEAAVIRAVLRAKDTPEMGEVMEIIRTYFARCELGKVAISELYDTLMGPPFGIRKGVLPILLAIGLRDRLSQATLYNHKQEQRIDGEALNAFDEHYQDYSLLIDRGSADQAEYLKALHEQYTPTSLDTNLRMLHEEMSRLVRALPRCARTNRNILTVDGVLSSIPSTWIETRSALLRYGGNSRDTLLVMLPKAQGQPVGKECAYSIIDTLSALSKYCSDLITALRTLTIRRLGYPQRTLRGAMTMWLQEQPSGKLNRAHDNSTTAVLNVLRSEDNHTDREWINMLAVALTNLPVEDWSDQQAEAFPGLLDTALASVENASEESESQSATAHVDVAIAGKVVKQAIENEELMGLANVVYDSLRSTLNEYGDALTTEEKLTVIAHLLVRLNEKE